MTTKNQTFEELVNTFYCTLEDDDSGKTSEDLSSELIIEGMDSTLVTTAHQEATRLFSRHCATDTF